MRSDERITSAAVTHAIVVLGGHPLPAAVEALLGAPGPLDHQRVLVTVARGQLVADPGPLTLVPGGLDQQPAGVLAGRMSSRTAPGRQSS